MPFGIWQPMACEWFPIDPDENLNFKFISKFALINVILFFFFTNSNFVVLIKQKI
jgi:hypothetical protein